MTVGENTFSIKGNSVKEIGWEEIAQLTIYRDGLDKLVILKIDAEKFVPLGDFFAVRPSRLTQDMSDAFLEESRKVTRRINELTLKLTA